MKLKILFVSMIVGIMLFVQVQPAKSYTKNIAGDPISLVWHFLNVTYEFQTGPQNSMTLYGSFFFPYAGWTSVGFGASYRWYLLQSKGNSIIKGFSFGPKATISYWGNDMSTGGVSFSLGGEAGYKWIFNGGFSVEPMFNIIIPFSSYYLSGVYVGLGVNLGYAW